jgi:hypothetical protein
LIYATLWIGLGHIFGDQVMVSLQWLGRRRALWLIGPAAVVAIIAYRMWRRWRYGAARPVPSPQEPAIEPHRWPVPRGR